MWISPFPLKQDEGKEDDVGDESAYDKLRCCVTAELKAAPEDEKQNCSAYGKAYGAYKISNYSHGPCKAAGVAAGSEFK